MPDDVVPAIAELVTLIRIADEAIGQYAALRAAIFRELVAMRALGTGWKIQYERDPAEGDVTIPAKWTYHTTTGPIIINGQVLNGIGRIKEPETYAPIKSFDFLDANDRTPEPESEAAAAESRLLFLLNATLGEVKALAGALPAIQHEAKQRNLTTDTESLARLDLQMPVFPYWPRAPKEMTQADFDRILSDEKPLLDDARLTLHRVSIEATSLAESAQAIALPGTSPAEELRAEAERQATELSSHSSDFTTVHWFGTDHIFNGGQQAKAVGRLWKEWEAGGHGISEKTIGEEIGSAGNNYRLAMTFRNHRALGTMIVKLAAGIYALKKPE